MRHAAPDPEHPWGPDLPRRHASLVGRDMPGSPADDPTGPNVDTGPFPAVRGGEPDGGDWDDEPGYVAPPAVPVEDSPELVVLSQAVTVVLMALVGLGWIKLDETGVNLVATAIAGVIIATTTVVTRSKVWTRAAVQRELDRRNQG